MPRRVLVHRRDQFFNLVQVPARDEHQLQEVMKMNPQLIPTDDLGLDGDLLVVGRETTLESGRIDLLCLARSGDLVLIEFKTGPDNPDFRSALAQLIDYGSDLWRTSRDDFDRGVVQRYLKGVHCIPSYKAAADLDEAISLTDWHLSTDELETLRSRLADVLATGDFIFVVAAQRFTPAMTVSLDYLNSMVRFGRFYLVEIVRLEGQDLTAHAAQVVASPPKQKSPSASISTSHATEADFLASIVDDAYRDAMTDLFSICSTLGLVCYWGLVGASIRIRTPDRNELLSIGWVFPEGGAFQGARHLSLGVAPWSLEHSPSVKTPVLRFIQRLSAIDGSIRVPTTLDAYMFEPAVVPVAKAAIVEAIEALVEEVQDLGADPASVDPMGG